MTDGCLLAPTKEWACTKWTAALSHDQLSVLFCVLTVQQASRSRQPSPFLLGQHQQSCHQPGHSPPAAWEPKGQR